jgi:hypothetical protein
VPEGTQDRDPLAEAREHVARYREADACQDQVAEHRQGWADILGFCANRFAAHPTAENQAALHAAARGFADVDKANNASLRALHNRAEAEHV